MSTARLVSELLAQKGLTRVLDEYCPQFPAYFLYYPSRVNLAPKLKALVDFLRSSEGRRRPASGVGKLRRTKRA
jgi:DNA-binding transcriptional LysR family regulator